MELTTINIEPKKNECERERAEGDDDHLLWWFNDGSMGMTNIRRKQEIHQIRSILVQNHFPEIHFCFEIRDIMKHAIRIQQEKKNLHVQYTMYIEDEQKTISKPME